MNLSDKEGGVASNERGEFVRHCVEEISIKGAGNSDYVREKVMDDLRLSLYDKELPIPNVPLRSDERRGSSPLFHLLSV